MKFPITREELQSYNYSSIIQQRIEENINEKISEIIKNICDDFERNLLNNINEKQFVWYWDKGYGIERIIQYSSGTYGLSELTTIKMYTENTKNDFMERLRELFIGCNIIMDPLQTYILINWF